MTSPSRWKHTLCIDILVIYFSYLGHFWMNIWITSLNTEFILVSITISLLSTCICNIWHRRSSDFDVWHAALTVHWQTTRSPSDSLSWHCWRFPRLLPWEYSPSIPPFTLMQEVSKLEGNCFNLRPIRCLPLPELYLCRCYLRRSTWEHSSRQQQDYWVWKSLIWGNRPT